MKPGVEPTARHPSAAETVDFPVRFPTRLPANAPLRTLFLAGTSAIVLQYDLPGAWRRSDRQLWTVLADPNAVGGPAVQRVPGDRLLEVGPTGRGRVRFRIGGELVIVPRSTILPSELAEIERSMAAHAR